MSVTIPSAYVVDDLNDGAGVSPGVPVLATPLQTIAGNHNFARANFTPPILYAASGAGFTHSVAGEARDLVLAVVPGQADSQGITTLLQAKVSSGTGTIAVIVGATATTITMTETSYTLKTLTHATTSASAFTIKIRVTPNVTIGCAVSHWTKYSGTISDTIQSSGFRWAQSSEFAATEPLTVEQSNRLLEMPRLIASKVPQTIFQLHGNLVETGFAKKSATTFKVAHKSKILINHKCQISWALFSVGPSGSQTKIVLTNQAFEQTVSTINASATSLPSNPGGTYTPGSALMSDVLPGLYTVEIKMKSGTGGTDHSLYTLSGSVFPPS